MPLSQCFRRFCVVASLAGLLAACGRPGAQPLSQPQPLSGAVSSFAAQAFFCWFNQLAVHHNINSELEVVGSGDSIRALLNGTVDFAATDSPPSPQELQSARHGLVAFPVTAGAIAVGYNLPGGSSSARPAKTTLNGSAMCLCQQTCASGRCSSLVSSDPRRLGDPEGSGPWPPGQAVAQLHQGQPAQQAHRQHGQHPQGLTRIEPSHQLQHPAGEGGE